MKPFEIGLKEYGVEEIVGSRHNSRVINYSKTIGLSWVKDDELAWCASFIGYCLVKAGLKSTKKLNARSYLTWGEETKKPQLGDLVVFWRISKQSAYGHVGFYINEENGMIRILSGNQSNKVNIQDYPKVRVLSYRKVPVVEVAKSTSKARLLVALINFIIKYKQ